MLILTRREGEVLTIQTSDGPIIVQVTQIYGGQVKLGIEAPKQCDIQRAERWRQTAR